MHRRHSPAPFLRTLAAALSMVAIALSAAAFPALAAATTGGRGQEPSAQTLEHGKALYEEQCASCHGDAGKGDGPAARYQDPAPHDFTAGDWRHASAGTAAAVAQVVRDGIEETGMTPFEGLLSDEEIAAVANYVVHVLAKPGAPASGGIRTPWLSGS